MIRVPLSDRRCLAERGLYFSRLVQAPGGYRVVWLGGKARERLTNHFDRGQAICASQAISDEEEAERFHRVEVRVRSLLPVACRSARFCADRLQVHRKGRDGSVSEFSLPVRISVEGLVADGPAEFEPATGSSERRLTRSP